MQASGRTLGRRHVPRPPGARVRQYPPQIGGGTGASGPASCVQGRRRARSTPLMHLRCFVAQLANGHWGGGAQRSARASRRRPQRTLSAAAAFLGASGAATAEGRAARAARLRPTKAGRARMAAAERGWRWTRAPSGGAVSASAACMAAAAATSWMGVKKPGCRRGEGSQRAGKAVGQGPLETCDQCTGCSCGWLSCRSTSIVGSLSQGRRAQAPLGAVASGQAVQRSNRNPPCSARGLPKHLHCPRGKRRQQQARLQAGLKLPARNSAPHVSLDVLVDCLAVL